MEVETQDRENLAALVLAHHGRAPSSIEAIEAGLGARRFYRLHFDTGSPETLVARIEPGDEDPSGADPIVTRTDLPPAWLPEPSLEPLRTFLEEAGLPVPRSYAHVPLDGLDLLEDVGDCTLGAVVGGDRVGAYREACDLVPKLQRLSASADRIPAFGRRLDRALIETKAWKCLHWAIPGLLDREPTEAETQIVGAAFARIASILDPAPMRLSHRDFKAENLHWVLAPDDRNASSATQSGSRHRLVMIDVQGAFMAPPEYDLVCLLYDLQVGLKEDFVQACFRQTLPALPDAPDLETAQLRFDAIATMRLCKDLAHVIHAGRARNDRRRWHEIPRGLALAGRAAGRLAPTFPEIRALTSVIQALTAAAHSSDSSNRIQGNA